MAGSSREAGFSLVELMIVVAILGIMAAVGIPTFRGMMPRIRLGSNAMVLSNEIALARVRAISKSSDFQIVFNPSPTPDSPGSYTPSRYNGSWPGASLGTTVLSGTFLGVENPAAPPAYFGAVVLPSTALVPANTLYFSGNGQVANIPLGRQAAVELRTPDGAARKRIVVEPTGRVTTQRWNSGAWTEE